MHPTQTSVTGSGNMDLEIQLSMRESLASATAFDVRRGWAGLHEMPSLLGQSISLETSEDWIVNPGRIDLLTDYVLGHRFRQ